MNNIKSVKALLTLINNLLINKKYLNDDLTNNYAICKEACRKTLFSTGVTVNVHGEQNIPSDGPLLLVSNHISFFDIILLVSIIDRPLPFAAACELMSYPILRDYIKAIKCVLIDRNASSMSVMGEQLKAIKNSISDSGLIVFPEGECSFDNEIYDFKKGAFLSLKGAKIVPTYISMPSIKKIGKWTIPTSDVEVLFGNSFTIDEIDGNKKKADVVAHYTREKVLELKHSLTLE